MTDPKPAQTPAKVAAPAPAAAMTMPSHNAPPGRRCGT
jgi:hypothetical protein